MIATLPMYDRPETRAATDRFWDLVRSHLDGAPEELTRGDAHWMDPDLLVSQTCSLPYRTALQDTVAIVATPVHDLPCPAGMYYSVVVVRDDDEREDIAEFNQSCLAINSPISQSGWAAIDDLAQDSDIRFSRILETGSHQNSAEAVVNRRADICAIDAVCWEMIRRWDASAKGLRVIAKTPNTPALPYITALGRDPAPIQEALVEAVHALSAEDRKDLCLIDMTHIPAELYLTLPIPPAPATTSVSAG